MSWRHALMLLASSPEELCGLRYGVQIHAVSNTSAKPCVEYAMDAAQQLELMARLGWPDAVWHTHPGGRREPSTLDHDSAIKGVEYTIICQGWMGSWRDREQVQEATMGTQTNDVVEVYKDKAERWRWRRIAPNGATIGSSNESFDNRANAGRAARRANPDAFDQDTAGQPSEGGVAESLPDTAGTTTAGPTAQGYSDGGAGPMPPATGPAGGTAGTTAGPAVGPNT